MNSFLSYILYSSAITLCLYLIYKWLLSKETFYRFNRAYLLAAYAVAFLALPAKWIAAKLSASPVAVAAGAVKVDGAAFEGLAPEVSDQLLPDGLISAIFAVYLVGLIAVVAQTIIVAVHIALTIRRGEKSKIGRYTLAVTNRSRLAPFSICGYVIVNRSDYDEADRMILTHEINHQRQLHWVDLFVAQAVIALQWFNPAAWLMRDELRSVHEFQADMAVISQGANAKEYQLLLIKKAIGAKFPALANCLNHSNLKKRITMMLKSKSSPWARMRALAAIPAVVVVAAVVNPQAIASALTRSGVGELELGRVDTDKITEKTGELPNSAAKILRIPADTDANALVINAETSEASEVLVSDETPQAEKPDFYVNGVKVDEAVFKALDPKAIESITVDKKKDAVYVKLKPEAAADAVDEVADAVDVMPQFPGGESAMLKFLADNLRYPQSAFEAGKEGRVVVRFVISKTGKVTDAEVVRSVDADLDAAAVDVVKSLPDFVPGSVNGQPVACKYVLPVSFKLTKPENK